MKTLYSFAILFSVALFSGINVSGSISQINEKSRMKQEQERIKILEKYNLNIDPNAHMIDLSNAYGFDDSAHSSEKPLTLSCHEMLKLLTIIVYVSECHKGCYEIHYAPVYPNLTELKLGSIRTGLFDNIESFLEKICSSNMYSAYTKLKVVMPDKTLRLGITESE